MWIFCSMLSVSVSLVITSRCYKKICPGIKLISSELVLFPFRFKLKNMFLKSVHKMCAIFMSFLRMRISDVIERHPRDSVPVGRSSNLVFTIWAVFGGFILHFLLSNYLTVLLRPSYEEPVETAEDLVKRDIIPFFGPGGEIYLNIFAASEDPNYQEIAKRLYIAKDWDEYEDLVRKVKSTGMYADIGYTPSFNSTDEVNYWYQSSETIGGDYPYLIHLSNKKWPMLKVC